MYRKLGRVSSHRQLMLRNLVTSLLKHEKIKTTEARAKEARKMAEKMITLAKKNDLHARRQVMAYVTEKEVINKIFNEFPEKYQDKNGGYTRMYKLGPRKSDAAPMVLLELV